ncbi:hypothetical protein ACFL0A_01620 [Patescibacteria group bacterium]
MAIDLVQTFEVEIDSIKLLKEYLKIAMKTVFNSNEEIAIKILDEELSNHHFYIPLVLNKDKSFHLILLSGRYKPEKGKSNSYFDGYPGWITFEDPKGVIQYVEGLFQENEKRWVEQFYRTFGNGYSKNFTDWDGTARYGWKIRSCRCFPEILAISMVHIYYYK